MARLILIETSTSLCSTALSEDGKIISYKENADRSHASLTAQFISDMLEEHGLTAGDCDAVCVSMGPGSYTGLRVGVSTAKGLCFGAGKPLLAIGSLDILVWNAISGSKLPEGCRYIVPMIDARRMEVYSAVFTPDGRQVRETAPAVIDKDSFSDLLAEGPVLFIGDGAGKCEGVIDNPAAHFINVCPDAASMLVPAENEYKEKRFKDVAYFEPFYLKDFVATVSKKKLF
ncbi:MAG: tRNA (adenosine(37)-N6)-threonylcarbamoyltransferase complex dimerization subunit type 1 TsaB [Bacteroidota bacterium]|nr:tRNA (adenosine(37)-N6)-threonylcarbamoyltransferase complex dimerization subunit type 1 TsaB [Bacteroidota bacterium]